MSDDPSTGPQPPDPGGVPGPEGGPVPFLGSLLSLVAVVVIIATISSNPDNRGYHDTFAGTAVVQ